MTIIEVPDIQDVKLAMPDVHSDERGLFVETYRKEWFGTEMVQANRADRAQGCIVGLHYHLKQADYWYVPFGRARVVLYDLRINSPTQGSAFTLDLGIGQNVNTGVYIPAGVAHGFAALTDITITYLVDRYYDPADELGMAYNDPNVAVDWGIETPVLSERDQQNPLLADIADELLPRCI